MTIKQGGKDLVYLITGKISSGRSRFLVRYLTYELDKLLDAIRCSRYSFTRLLGEDGQDRGLSPALTAAQMKRAECSFVPTLLQYAQISSDRTVPCGAVDATCRNRSGIWHNHQCIQTADFLIRTMFASAKRPIDSNASITETVKIGKNALDG